MRIFRTAALTLPVVASAACASILGDFSSTPSGATDSGADGFTNVDHDGSPISNDSGPTGNDATTSDDATSSSETGTGSDAGTPPEDAGHDSAPSCTADVCSCPPTETLCNGACLSLATDNTHCGTTCSNATACDTKTTACQAGVCAPCTSPLTDCNGACVDITQDGANCGVCGHSCGGGLCATSKCQPVQIAGGMTGTGTNPLPSLLVADGNLYGTYNPASGGQVYQIPVNAPASTTPATTVTSVTGPISNLVFDGTSIWFGNTATPASIYYAKLTALGTPIRSTYASGSGVISSFGTLDNFAYWSQGTGTLYEQLGVSTATPTLITPSTSRAIGSDTAAVYWAKGGGAIYAGHGDLSVAANNAVIGQSPASIAFDRLVTDASNVYFGEGDGIWYLPKSGAPSPTQYFMYAPYDTAQIFAPDPDAAGPNVYYMTNDFTDYAATSIYFFAKNSPVGKVPTVAPFTTLTAGHLQTFTVDSTYVYFTTDLGQVWRLAK